MKKTIALLLATIVIIAISGCSLMKAPSGMTPEETVRYYFEQWNERDDTGMRTVVYDNMPYAPQAFGTISLTLADCEEIEDADYVSAEYQRSWYFKEPYAVALVRASFDIEYEPGASVYIDNGENELDFWLIKANEESDWMIVSWGRDDSGTITENE